MKTPQYTRFERARIIGARSLQVSLGAPILIVVPEGLIDPISIAEKEFEENVIPITVKREDVKVARPARRRGRKRA